MFVTLPCPLSPRPPRGGRGHFGVSSSTPGARSPVQTLAPRSKRANRPPQRRVRHHRSPDASRDPEIARPTPPPPRFRILDSGPVALFARRRPRALAHSEASAQRLTGLTIQRTGGDGDVELTPAFDPDVDRRSYTVTADNGVESLTVNAQADGSVEYLPDGTVDATSGLVDPRTGWDHPHHGQGDADRLDPDPGLRHHRDAAT